MGLIGLTAVRQATATIKLMQVSTGMKSATMSGLIKFNWPFGSKVQNICCSSIAHKNCISQMTVDSWWVTHPSLKNLVFKQKQSSLGPHSPHHPLPTCSENTRRTVEVLHPTWLLNPLNWIHPASQWQKINWIQIVAPFHKKNNQKIMATPCYKKNSKMMPIFKIDKK